MEKSNKGIELLWKITSSDFYKKNIDSFAELTRPFGSATNAVKTLMSHSEELKVILKPILGVNPESVTSNWDALCKEYLDGIDFQVPKSGIKLEIGFTYDITSPRCERYIAPLKAAHKEIITDKLLADYVENNVEEDEKYKYGEPINHDHYIIYRYALLHPHVSNDMDTVDKSANIRFLLRKEIDIAKARKDKYANDIKVMNVFMEVAADPTRVIDVLNLDSKWNSDMDADDCLISLKELSVQYPEKFMRLATDPNLKAKAKIERYILAGLLNRIPNSSIIRDGQNPELILGNTMDEVITFMVNDKNKPLVTEYDAKYSKYSKDNKTKK